MPIMSAAIAGGAALLGGALTSHSAKQNAREANQASSEMSEAQRAWSTQEAATAREFNAQQAAGNRDWQQWMSGTAHQREVQDLRAAGLNPILSGTHGMGSSTPSGSAASASPPSGSTGTAHQAQTVDIVGPAIATALNVANKTAERDLLEAQAGNVRSETSFRDTYLTAKTDAEIATMVVEQGLKSEQASLTTAQRESVIAHMDLIEPQVQHLVADAKAAMASAVQHYASARGIDEETRSRRVEAAANEWAEEYGLPKLRKALEVTNLGADTINELATAIFGSLRKGVLGGGVKPKPSGNQPSTLDPGLINKWLRKN